MTPPATSARMWSTRSRNRLPGRNVLALPEWSLRRTLAWLAVSFAGLGFTAHAAPSVNAVLDRMDEAAATWQGMRAQTEWVRYLSLVDDRRVESGRIAVQRSKSGTFAMLLEFNRPARYFVSVRDAKVERYKPKTKTVEVYDLSDSKDQLNNALLLGFGVSGNYLREHYTVAIDGEEAVSGQPTVKLDLRPKNPKGKVNNRRLQMWISTALWQPVQQKVFDLNPEDFRQQTYSEIEINPSFRPADFRLPLAPGTKRVRPQR